MMAPVAAVVAGSTCWAGAGRRHHMSFIGSWKIDDLLTFSLSQHAGILRPALPPMLIARPPIAFIDGQRAPPS